jgi:phosphoglycolate phosphatase
VGLLPAGTQFGKALDRSDATLCSPFRLDRRTGLQTEPVQSGRMLLPTLAEFGKHFVNIDRMTMDWLKDVQAIALDKDGTFIDFSHSWGGALNRVIDQLSPEPELGQKVADMLGFDRAKIAFDPDSSFVGGSHDSYGPIWAGLLGVPYDKAFNARIADAFEEHVFESLRLIEGAEPALRSLGNLGLPLGVVTNDTIRATTRQLSYLELQDLFGFVAGYDSGHGPKPSGAMVRAFARSADVAPDRVMMVGDSINDALAARDAGARMVGVRTGPELHPDFEALCDIVLPSIRDLPVLLRQKTN